MLLLLPPFRSLLRWSPPVHLPTTTAMAALLSRLTVATVGLTFKALIESGLCSLQVNRLNVLLDALEHPNRNSGHGVVTGEFRGWCVIFASS